MTDFEVIFAGRPEHSYIVRRAPSAADALRVAAKLCEVDGIDPGEKGHVRRLDAGEASLPEGGVFH